MKTVFITGASSGIGRAVAFHFQEKGWNVVATMRNIEKETELSLFPNILVAYCDVLNKSSILEAIQKGIERFGSIDVLINNAGYYTIGTLEATSSEEIQRQIDTNLIGVIEVTKALIPHFREQKYGTIINISSIAGIISVPLQSIYHASKWGLEGFSEALQYELQQFNISVKLIEPGVINTNFYDRSMTVNYDIHLDEYKSYEEGVLSNLIDSGKAGSSSTAVALEVFKSANDNKKSCVIQRENQNI